jgi:diguanylate cyclase
MPGLFAGGPAGTLDAFGCVEGVIGWRVDASGVHSDAANIALRSETMLRLMEENRCLRSRLNAEQRTTASLRVALEQHRREALTDPLTGLFNRRAMDQRLDEIWAKPEAEGLAIVVMDIDFFKRINDTYGHADGDCVIRWVAATLCRCIRAGDSAFRYGGEEFMVLLPNTSLEGAVSLAESIRGRIEACHQAFSSHWQVPLTVSLGVASRKQQDDPTSMFKRADRALYQAKHEGRNRVAHENSLR